MQTKGMNMVKYFKSIPMALATAALLAVMPVPEGAPMSATAAAQDAPKNKQKTRKVPAMSLEVHKQVQKAQEALDIDDVPAAEEYLQKALDKRNINDYEKAVVWQMRAMIAFEKENTPDTIKAYEMILTFRESIPEALEIQIIYGLAQLQFSEENYKESLIYINEWEEKVDPTVVGVAQLTFISQLHYQLTDFETSLEYIYKAIAQAEALDEVEVKENWYNLALSSHWELNQYGKVRDVLEILLIRWPNPTYWTQLAGIYQELGQEETSFSLSEAAYKQGFFNDKPQNLINVAQIQLARGAPIKCAWVLENSLKDELIEDNPDNALLLGQCYLAATEYRKALAPLSVAAASESDGDLWLQIGQVQMQIDRYDDAVKSLEKMEVAFEDDKENAEKNQDKLLAGVMMRGQALTELKKFKEAKDAFRKASRLAKSEKERRAVANWRRYMNGEEAREKMLTGG